jgi:nucleoid DNA-binding protein
VDITAFIRELLFCHDCVIVPGFGGFIGNYMPARLDKTTSMFYPPVKQISFNRNLNHNDGLLVGKISGILNINYGDSRTAVEEFVTEVKRKLGKGERIVFDNIGSFINNQEGNIQFEPDSSVNYHLDSYGFEAFQCAPLEGYDVKIRISGRTGKDPVKQTVYRKVLWRAAVIIPLLLIAVAVPLKTDIFRSKIESSTLNPLSAAEFEHNKKAVDEDSKIALKDISTENISAVSSEAAAVPDLKEDSYILVTGSFKSEANAVIQANMLKEEGFAPEIVYASNGFYRVTALKCNDLNTAKSKRDSIVKKFPGSWISKKI